MPIATVNGVDLRYETFGTGTIPILMIHGSWGSHQQWDTVAAALAPYYRVVTYDRRGHSDSSGEGVVIDDVNDAAALIESLDIAPAFVAGNSFGSAIALRLAAFHPNLVRGIILHEPPLFPLLLDDAENTGALEGVLAHLGRVVEKLAAGDHVGGAELFMTELALAPGEWDQLPETLQQTVVENARTFLDETNDPDALQFDLGWIKNFAKPALLTIGERSPSNYAPVLDKLASVLPDADRLTFQEAGHIPHATHPDAYVDAIRAFVDLHVNVDDH